VAGIKENDWKLGFIEETEKQVTDHLKESMKQLPVNDTRSKEFLKKISKDEEKHRDTVKRIGSNEIPNSIKTGMNLSSKIMKKLTSLF
jgi:ubiquinone biosynthesis monooxygenase Coq7